MTSFWKPKHYAMHPDWNRLHHELVSFVQKKIGEKNTAQDIVQDVFIKIHAKSDQLKDPDRFTGWAFKITRNAIADYFRRQNRKVDSSLMEWHSDTHELNECVASCLAVLMGSLPEKYRIALQLTDIEDQTQQELARVLKISHAGARSRVQRARKMLRARMDELFIIQTDTYGNITVCENRDPCCCRT